ncbi:unnamed protein product [Pylaiella littoralis]
MGLTGTSVSRLESERVRFKFIFFDLINSAEEPGGIMEALDSFASKITDKVKNGRPVQTFREAAIVSMNNQDRQRGQKERTRDRVASRKKRKFCITHETGDTDPVELFVLVATSDLAINVQALVSQIVSNFYSEAKAQAAATTRRTQASQRTNGFSSSKKQEGRGTASRSWTGFVGAFKAAGADAGAAPAAATSRAETAPNGCVASVEDNGASLQVAEFPLAEDILEHFPDNDKKWMESLAEGSPAELWANDGSRKFKRVLIKSMKSTSEWVVLKHIDTRKFDGRGRRSIWGGTVDRNHVNLHRVLARRELVEPGTHCQWPGLV